MTILHLPFHKKNLFLAAAVFLFILIKWPAIGIHLSDSNIYFYIGRELLQGRVLYKDIFFTDMPLFAYVSAFYHVLVSGNLHLFYALPLFETTLTAGILFVVVRQEYKSYLLSTMTAVTYLFSLLILTTTAHETGVFLASLFFALGYAFFVKQRFVPSGIFFALMLLIKAYFIPLFLAVLLTLLVQKKWQALLSFLIASSLTLLVLLLPTFLISFPSFFSDTFLYSLVRLPGVSKADILTFFITHDPLLVILLISNIILVRRNLFLALLTVCSIIFFFAYQDMYYLYLNFLGPVAALGLPELSRQIQKRYHVERFVIPTIIVVVSAVNVLVFQTSFADLGRVDNIRQIVTDIKIMHPSVLYGADDITPALSYLSGVPLLNNIIDTNYNIYRKGRLNAHNLTEQAIKQHAVLVAHGAFYPGYINNMLIDGIFQRNLVVKSCRIMQRYPVSAEGLTNRIVLYACGK